MLTYRVREHNKHTKITVPIEHGCRAIGPTGFGFADKVFICRKAGKTINQVAISLRVSRFKHSLDIEELGEGGGNRPPTSMAWA